MITKTEKARFDTRLPKEQKELFERAAIIGGFRTLTDFMIFSAKEKAKEIIRENEALLVSERDKEVFFNAIINAEKPSKKLLSAAKRYKEALS